MFVEQLIKFEIFISNNKIFLKINYFPSQIFVFWEKKKINISENNIISVASLKLPTAIVCVASFRHFAKIIIFQKKNILLQILSFNNEIAEQRKSPKIARTATIWKVA